MSSTLNVFREKTAEKMARWRTALFSSPKLLTSTEHCYLSISAGKINMLSVRPRGNKLELVLTETLPFAAENEVTTVLSKAVQQYALTGMACSWILGSEYYQLLQTEALPVPDAEFQSAIRWKVKDLLRFPVADAVIDQFPLPLAKLPTSVAMIMLVAARASLLKPLCDQISASGLKLTTIDIPELSLRNLVTPLVTGDNLNEQTVALLYMQEEASLLLVVHEEQLCFTRRLDFGLHAFEGAISSSDSLAANPLIDEFALDIQRSFDYVQSQWRYPEPARILLCTERAFAQDFSALLEQRLNTAVRSVDISHAFINTAKLDIQTAGFFLPLLGESLREGKEQHAATN